MTLWAVVCHAPLSLGFSRQEHWSGLPCPPPGNLPNPGIEPSSHALLHWQVGSLSLAPPRKPMKGQVFCVLLVVSYSCIAEYCRLSCFNKKDACSQSWKPDVCELAWAGCFLLWPVSSVYQWVVPTPSSNGLYSVCV